MFSVLTKLINSATKSVSYLITQCNHLIISELVQHEQITQTVTYNVLGYG